MQRGQINLFEQIERENSETARKQKVRDEYRMWKRIPEIVPFKNEHLKMFNVFNPSPIHICAEMPEAVKIWWNVGASQKDNEYWVLSKKAVCGEAVKECPYCNAKLAKGEGERHSVRWTRGETFYKEKSVREYYELDQVDKEE